MKKRSLQFRITDAVLIALTLLPLIAGMVLKVLYTPAADGISIQGALVYFSVPMPFFGDLPITESQVNSWLIIVSVFFLCLYMTHGVNIDGGSRRQLICEWIVEKTEELVETNMNSSAGINGYFSGFAPFIAAIMALSAFSSLSSLLGLYPPTSDLNIAAGWALLVFILITYYKFKGGPIEYVKGFADPAPVLLPLNIISEAATPVSMAFRHYGNILSGLVISSLVAAALTSLSSLVFGWLPGFASRIPLFRIGLPAVLSVYFDLFSGLLQAFIFAMLTMLYIAGGFPADAYMKRQEKRAHKKLTNK